jgi:hypothetical protein
MEDWVVPGSDWAGFRMFAGKAIVGAGWSPVRVPPRARVFPVQGFFSL